MGRTRGGSRSCRAGPARGEPACGASGWRRPRPSWLGASRRRLGRTAGSGIDRGQQLAGCVPARQEELGPGRRLGKVGGGQQRDEAVLQVGGKYQQQQGGGLPGRLRGPGGPGQRRAAVRHHQGGIVAEAEDAGKALCWESGQYLGGQREVLDLVSCSQESRSGSVSTSCGSVQRAGRERQRLTCLSGWARRRRRSRSSWSRTDSATSSETTGSWRR